MTEAEQKPTADPPGRSRLPLWTGLAGFLAGAVFWHLVGFWSFVAEVVYNQDETKSPTRFISLEEARSVSRAHAEQALAGKRRDPAPRETRSAVAADVLDDLLNCSEVRRAADGRVAVTACAPLARPLAAGPLAARADRQMDAREAEQRLMTGWSTGVSRIETGSLQAGDH